MSSYLRFFAVVFRALPVILIVGILFLVLTSDKSRQSRLEKHAAFADHDERGSVSALEFTDHVPEPGQLRNLSSLRRLNIENAVITQQLLEAIATIENLTSLSLKGSDLDGELSLLSQLQQLRSLDLSGCIGRADETAMLDLPTLQALHLNGCTWVDDNCLSRLGGFPQLQSLQLKNTAVSDIGIQQLAQLPGLFWLDLSDCPGISDESFTQLKELQSLKRLTLSGEHISLRSARAFQNSRPDVALVIPLIEFSELRALLQHQKGEPNTDTLSSGLRRLSIQTDTREDYSALTLFPELKALSLSGAGIDDQTTSFLVDMRQLEYLSLRESDITDAAMEHLSSLTRLKLLDLADTDITDQGLRHVGELINLQTLDLSNTRITEAGLEHLVALENLTFLELPERNFDVQNAEIMERLPRFSGTLDLSLTRMNDQHRRVLLNKPVSSACLRGHTLQHADFELIQSWSELRDLDLSMTLWLGGDFRLIDNAQLQTLQLDGAQMTDADLAQISLPASLSSLSLADTAIAGDTLLALAHLKLHSLNLSNTMLSENGIRNAFAVKADSLILKNMRNAATLQEIDTGSDGIQSLTIEASAPLLKVLVDTPGASGLRRLNLQNASTEHVGLVARFTGLTALTLERGDFRHGSFVQLSGNRRLREVHLIECQCDQAAMTEINDIPALDQLTIESSLPIPEIPAALKNNPRITIHSTLTE